MFIFVLVEKQVNCLNKPKKNSFLYDTLVVNYISIF